MLLCNSIMIKLKKFILGGGEGGYNMLKLPLMKYLPLYMITSN